MSTAHIEERDSIGSIEVLNIPQAIRAAPQQPAENVLALVKRVAAEIMAVVPKAIEGIKNRLSAAK